MLYDIAPPLLFFASLGGIILVVSRVVVRMKRLEFSEAIQTEGARVSRPAHQLLNPQESRIKLMQSRIAAAGTNLKQSLAFLKNVPSRLKGVSRRLRQIVSQRRRPAAPVPTPPSVTAPRVQLRRVEAKPTPPAAAPRVETTAQRLQALVRKQRATTSPVAEAQAALSAGNLSQAEDILVSYIVKHPKNTVAYLLLGEIAAKREAWNEAVEILEQVIRLDAAAPGGYAKLGEVALQAGRVTRALEALQRAHDLEPENIAVLKNLLKIAQRLDNRVLQKSVLQKLMVVAPDDSDVHLAAQASEERERNHTQPA